MSVEVACTCGGLPAHSHVPTRWAVVDGVYRPLFEDEWYVRVWVDWKAYARAVAREEAALGAEDPRRFPVLRLEPACATVRFEAGRLRLVVERDEEKVT